MKETTGWLVVFALLAAAGCAQDKTRLPPTIEPGIAAPDGALAETHPLFIIERSKNANTVHYDARLTADGELDPDEPVIAYYVMLAEDGRRKELNLIEKMMAYGFDIKPDPSVNGYRMTMVAAPQRAITVKRAGGAVRAELVIDDRPAVLEKMYIYASDGLPWPQVHYIELHGKDVQTEESRFEKILP
ncbi:MAG: DUF4833 domain-containing protein [Phycisphaerae bacterium]